jgi:CxxC-x17-CxxC domain-containing protein
MGDFKRGGGFGGKSGGSGFNNRGRGDERRGGSRTDFNRGGGRGGDRPEMFKAICATCNKSCDIPFKPTNDRPVYCSDCFQTNREREGGGRDDRGERRDRDSSQRYPKNSSSFTPPKESSDGKQIKELKRQFEITNDKLEQIIQILRGEVKGSRNTNEEKSLKSIVDEVVASDSKSAKKTKKKVAKKTAKKVTPKKVAKKATKKTAPKKVTKK